MKRNLKIRWGFGLLLALLASCSQSDDGTSHTADRQISFTGIVHPSTRATESAFEDEDEISVFAFKEGAGGFTSDSYATNVRYQYMDGKFQAVGQGVIYPQEQSLAFWAIYPYCESAAPAFTFDVQEDQRKVLNYSHSDLMTASTNNTTSTTPSLAFNHRLSCVTVNLTFEDTNSKAAQLNFTYVQKSASVNMTEATFRGIGEAVSTIRATPNGEGRFKVILPPQTIAQGTEFVEVTTEAVTEPAKTYRWKVPKDLVWVSGSRYTYNLNVSKVGEITFTSDINPWGDPEENPTDDRSLLIGKWEMTRVKGWEIVDGIKYEFDDEIGDDFYTFSEDGTGYNDYIHENSGNVRDHYNWSLQDSELSLVYADRGEGYTEKFMVKKITATVAELEYLDPDPNPDSYQIATFVKR